MPVLRSMAGLACLSILLACTTADHSAPETAQSPSTPVQTTATPPLSPHPAVEEDKADVAEGESRDRSGTTSAPARMLKQTEAARAQSPAVAGAMAPAARDEHFARYATLPENTEKYQHFDQNPIKLAAEHPVSTFSIDVDTGSYANVRRFLNEGQLPPKDAVRVEEMINYFPYAYAGPSATEDPFAVHTEMAPSPWNTDTHLLRIAIKGKELAKNALPPANLVFLIDVSGSMDEPSKLPLLKSAFRQFVRELRPQDKVSMVVYAGASGVVLPPTAGEHQDKILAALNRLSAGGSTHGAAGIELAYQMAQQGFVAGGINRVLLATDGDFNVGVTDFEALKSMIEHKRKSGVSLSTLGFGSGNYNDQLMEQLADVGNGNYSYIDTQNEARKALVEEFTSTLATIAKDVKVQVEFNPGVVAEYRLIGYENRALKREDFNNDKVDAGEIGAGHSVTALYEIRLQGNGKSLIDPLRYQPTTSKPTQSDEVGLLRLRYKAPDGEVSHLKEVALAKRAILTSPEAASAEFRFAAAVAAFGQALRGGTYLGEFGFDAIGKLAKDAIQSDRFGYRAEFLELVDAAKGLSANPRAALDTPRD